MHHRCLHFLSSLLQENALRPVQQIKASSSGPPNWRESSNTRELPVFTGVWTHLYCFKAALLVIVWNVTEVNDYEVIYYASVSFSHGPSPIMPCCHPSAQTLLTAAFVCVLTVLVTMIQSSVWLTTPSHTSWPRAPRETSVSVQYSQTSSLLCRMNDCRKRDGVGQDSPPWGTDGMVKVSVWLTGS